MTWEMVERQYNFKRIEVEGEDCLFFVNEKLYDAIWAAWDFYGVTDFIIPARPDNSFFQFVCSKQKLGRLRSQVLTEDEMNDAELSDLFQEASWELRDRKCKRAIFILDK